MHTSPIQTRTLHSTLQSKHNTKPDLSLYGVILPPKVLNETGIPSDFFSDPYVRKGFAYAINYTEYLERLKTMYYIYEAQQPAAPITEGMPYANPNQPKILFRSRKSQRILPKSMEWKTIVKRIHHHLRLSKGLLLLGGSFKYTERKH